MTNKFPFKQDQKVVFIGDSITDCDRRGAANAPYGNGYVSMIRNLLLARYPGLNLTIENRGIGGDTIRNLKARWETDVMRLKPDVLSIKIGINDVWRFVGGQMAEHVPLTEYETTYRELLSETRKKLSPRIILVDPYVIETNRKDVFREMMDRYIACVHRLADEFGAISVQTQAAFDTVLKEQPASFWACDRVHPYAHGHMVIARAFLNTVGYEF